MEVLCMQANYLVVCSSFHPLNPSGNTEEKGKDDHSNMHVAHILVLLNSIQETEKRESSYDDYERRTVKKMKRRRQK